MEQLGGIKIYPGAKVLDIGAGPGTLAVPLARRGCKVTVVEPSPMMVSALREYQASEQVEDIRIIEKRWEDVTIEELGGPFDIVIASYSLSMVDIGEAVRKMDTVCSGTVYLFWFLKPSPSSESPPSSLAKSPWSPILLRAEGGLSFYGPSPDGDLSEF